MPEALRRSQVQLMSLGLSQVGQRPWGSRTGVPLGARCLGAGLCEGRTCSLVWNGERQPSEGSLCLQPGLSRPTWKANSRCPGSPLGCQGGPAQSQPPEPASVSPGVSEKCPLSPRAALGGGTGLAAEEAPSLFGDSYQGNCLCCSSFRCLFSVTFLKMVLRS